MRQNLEKIYSSLQEDGRKDRLPIGALIRRHLEMTKQEVLPELCVKNLRL